MNAVPGSEPMQILARQWKNAINEPSAASAPSDKPRSRIDHILYRPASHLRLSSTKVIDESMASDHRPVFAIFQLTR